MLLRDLRHTLRALAKRPGYSVAVVLTLSLGIGAMTAIFSLANAVLLSRLPYPEPERLVVVTVSQPKSELQRGAASYPEIRDWRRRNRVFDDMAAFGAGRDLSLTGGEAPERVRASFVSPAYFRILGVKPLLGRTFVPEEEQKPGGHPVVVLSHALWQRRFGGDEGVLGETVSLNEQPYTIVGILGSGFQDLAFVAGFPEATDLWLPVAMVPKAIHPFYFESRQGRWMNAVARLKPEVELDEARAHMASVADNLARDYPETNAGYSASVALLRDHFFGFGRLQWSVGVLGLAAAFVLLVGAANVGNLSLVRASERRREMAVRRALGAGRGRLVRQALMESCLLALAGGVLGIWLARVTIRLLVRLSPLPLPGFVQVQVDHRLLLAAILLSLLTGLAFGLAPALWATRGELRQELGEGSGRLAPAGRTARLLVICEIACAALLLVGAGLMLKSFRRFHNTELGFRTQRILTLKLQLPAGRYGPFDRRRIFCRRLLTGLEALPGVEAAALWGPALPGSAEMYVELIPEGRSGEEPEERVRSYEHRVSPEALSRLGLPLLAGREITAADGADAAWVAVVSQSLAEAAWPGQEPLGQRFRRGAPGRDPWITVVGVIADAKQRGRQPQDSSLSDHYLALEQVTGRSLSVLLRTGQEPSSLVAEVRRVVASVDPELPVFDVTTMAERVARRESEPRFYSFLLGSFAAVALILALLGIYAVVAYWVRLRGYELAIRTALGARRRDVLLLIARESGALIGVGLVAGLVMAAMSSRLMSTLLYGVSATDPEVFVAVPLLLALATGAAAGVPAYRATRVNPVSALKAE